MKTARNFGIVALIALLIAVAPGGGSALNLILTLIGIAFFAGIAVFGYRFYREHRYTLESLPDLDRTVLYSSVGLAVLAVAAHNRLKGAGGLVLLIGLFAIASLGVYWVFRRFRRYD